MPGGGYYRHSVRRMWECFLVTVNCHQGELITAPCTKIPGRKTQCHAQGVQNRAWNCTCAGRGEAACAGGALLAVLAAVHAAVLGLADRDALRGAGGVVRGRRQVPRGARLRHHRLTSVMFQPQRACTNEVRGHASKWVSLFPLCLIRHGMTEVHTTAD